MSEKKKDLEPNATEMLTGEEPKEKVEKIDTETPPEEMLNLEGEKLSNDEVLENEILQLIFDDDKLAMITDINRKGAVVMARAEIISDRFNCKVLGNFAKSVKKHLVSNKRFGRKEVIEVASSFRDSLGGDLGVEEMNTSDKVWGKK